VSGKSKSGKIPKPPAELLNRIARLAPKTYIVGGAVRDRLLGQPAYDLDLVVREGGCWLARRLADALHGAYYALDPERDVGRAIVGGALIDVAQFRGPDLEADLRARDFTINAMALPVSDLSHLIDPLGGASDLERRILRQCAPDSIASDPVRAIRAARQAAQFDLQIEEETQAAARAAGPRLLGEDGTLAQPERVRDELVKLLALPGVTEALRLLVDLNLLQIVLPQAQAANVPAVGRLAQLQGAFIEGNAASASPTGPSEALAACHRQLREHLSQTFANARPQSALLRLVALSCEEGRPHPAAQAFTPWLRLSNEEQEYASRAEEALRRIQALTPPLAPRAIHRYYRDVEEAGVDGVMLAIAVFDEEPPESWLADVAEPLLRAFFRRHQQIVAPPPLVTGHDLMQHLKLRPGPQIGELLAQLLEEQAEGTIHSRGEALRMAEKLLRQTGAES
jgi:poly(A) polymerase